MNEQHATYATGGPAPVVTPAPEREPFAATHFWITPGDQVVRVRQTEHSSYVDADGQQWRITRGNHLVELVTLHAEALVETAVRTVADVLIRTYDAYSEHDRGTRADIRSAIGHVLNIADLGDDYYLPR